MIYPAFLRYSSRPGHLVASGFEIRWNHPRPSATIFPARILCCCHCDPRPNLPLTVPATPPLTKLASVARICATLKRRLFGCCLEEPQPGPSTSQIWTPRHYDHLFAAVTDSGKHECRMTTLNSSKGLSCGVFFPILKHVVLLVEIGFLLCFFYACFRGG